MKPVLAAALASLSAAAPSVQLVYHNRDPKTWFGCSAIGFQASYDPIFMSTTWVYGPNEIVAWRPSQNSNWTENTTEDLRFQTWYVTSTGTQMPAGAIDSLGFWNEKPDGIDGLCSLVGFNSAAAPNADQPSPPVWKTNLTTDCINVNGWEPFNRFDISSDGKTAIGWTSSASGNVTVYGLDGQTGALRWTRKFGVSEKNADYFLTYGASLAKNGGFVVADTCVEGTTPQYFHVLNTSDGSVRATVESTGVQLFQPVLSPDGQYILVSNDQSGLPTATVLKWSETTAKYEVVGNITATVPPSGVGSQYYLGDNAFSQYTDSTTGKTKTIVSVGWFSIDLKGEVTVGVWDADAPASGSIQEYVADSQSNEMAFSQLYIDCDGSMCAAALVCQVENGATPTVVLFDGSGAAGSKAAPAFNFTSPGSMNSVALAQAGPATTAAVEGQAQPELHTAAVPTSAAAGTTYYLATAGCDTVSVCTKAGADAYLWKITA